MPRVNNSGVARAARQSLNMEPVAKKGQPNTNSQVSWQILPAKKGQPNTRSQVSWQILPNERITIRTVRILPAETTVGFLNDGKKSAATNIPAAADRHRCPKQAATSSDCRLLQGNSGSNGSGVFLPEFDLFDLQFLPEHRSYLQALAVELSKAD